MGRGASSLSSSAVTGDPLTSDNKKVELNSVVVLARQSEEASQWDGPPLSMSPAARTTLPSGSCAASLVEWRQGFQFLILSLDRAREGLRLLV